MQITTNQILKFLYILSWIIFLGLCVEAGGILFNAVFSLLNPIGSKFFWNQVDLSGLYEYKKSHYIQLLSLAVIVSIVKAVMFYLIVKVLHHKKLNIEQPFNKEVVRFIFTVSYCTFLIGLFSIWGVNYTKWLIKKGVPIFDLHGLGIDGTDVWLFMSVVLIVIGHIFKKGIEIQTENELTV